MRGLWVPESTESFRRKFRDDYQFAMIVLFGALAAVVISGFVVYRYLAGFYFGGTVNLLIVISVLLVLVYAVRSGRTRRAGQIFAIVTVIACIASTAMFGRTGILWGYLVLWINFLLTGRQFALVANLILMTVLIIETSLFQSVLEGVTYIVTALLVTTFGYIFAERLARYQIPARNAGAAGPADICRQSAHDAPRSDGRDIDASKKRPGLRADAAGPRPLQGAQ